MASLLSNPTIPVQIADSELHEITSLLVGQKYYIKIRLPENYYETTESYPVLYLLDGDHAFAMATDIVQYLIYGGHIPDLIIVSPSYGSKKTPGYGGTNMRDRDLLSETLEGWRFTPGAAVFLQFLEQELMPFITTHYRVSASDRALAGYSLGSWFALYTLFQKPGLFNRIIAIDGLEDWHINMEEKYSTEQSTLPVRLFVSSGEYDMSGLANIMAQREYKGFSIEHAQLNKFGHFAVAAEGLTKGLVAVFHS
jgi:predicted alpha/beta superfamily hydrolase